MAYLEDLGLGTALVKLLGGEVDFKVMDGFEVVLVDEFTLVLVNVKGLGRAGALREPIDSNRSFPVISTPKMFFGCSCGNFSTHTGFQFQSVLFWVGITNLWLGDLDNHVY